MKHNLVGNKMPKLLRLVSNGPAHTSLKISMSTPSGNLFDPVVSRVVRRKVTHTLISRPKSIQNWTASLKKKKCSFFKLHQWKALLWRALVSRQFCPSDISCWVCHALLGKKRFNARLCLCLWMLILQRNLFSGGGIVLLVQAHTTLGMVAIIIMAASTTMRIQYNTTQ